MNDTQNLDRLELSGLLQQAKPLVAPLYPDQRSSGQPKARSLRKSLRFSQSIRSSTTKFTRKSAEFLPSPKTAWAERQDALMVFKLRTKVGFE